MPRSDDSLERLRAAIDELAAQDAADLLAEARSEARARVRATLTDALTQAMLERLHDQLDAPVQPGAKAQRRKAKTPTVADSVPAPLPEPPRAKPSGERAWYVYGVVAANTELEGKLPGVDPARPVTLLSEGGLAAVASQVPLDEFDETRLREHLADMVWVEATARAHEAVLEDVRRRATVIPMRMCTVYRTEGGIREMLTREADALRDALEHLNGKAEWGVKVFTDFARAGGRTHNVDAGAGEATGAAYMERIRTERELRERALAAAEDAAAVIHDRLGTVAADAQVIPLQRPEVSGHSGEMILNGVYLVSDEGASSFHEEAEALRTEFELHGIDVALTGPWPAYNFVPGTIGAAW
jgi:Gas vesicle synthesis protein GvpL/GvpF